MSTATQLRDDGISRVLDNVRAGWRESAMQTIRELPVGWVGIGEDIRTAVVNTGIGEPHHPNCWGALVMAARRAGMLRRNGEMRHAKSGSSHASLYPVLERSDAPTAAEDTPAEQIKRLRRALRLCMAIFVETRGLWDADNDPSNDVRLGKLLNSLASGVPNYRPDVAEILVVLREIGGAAPMPRGTNASEIKVLVQE